MSAPTDNPALARARDKLALLRNHSLFRERPSPVIERLGSYMKRRSVARGSTIFAKGDPGDALMGVLAGAVKISVPSADGRDVVLNIINEGGIFGEIALLDGHPRTADATAMSDCQLMIIERRDFLQFLRSQPDVTLKFIEILCARLAKTLLRLTTEGDAPAAKRKVTITQRELSQMIGMSRESTNKQLRAWAKRKWIELERGGVTVLQPERLAEAAEEGSELDRS
jgi:CRP/FNR family cyclic AMP-dependent transcriptional regulator